MADSKKEDCGTKNSRRNKTGSGYSAGIKEAEKMLAGEADGDAFDNGMGDGGSTYGAPAGNDPGTGDTAEQKLARMVEERNILIKELESGLGRTLEAEYEAQKARSEAEERIEKAKKAAAQAKKAKKKSDEIIRQKKKPGKSLMKLGKKKRPSGKRQPCCRNDST